MNSTRDFILTSIFLGVASYDIYNSYLSAKSLEDKSKIYYLIPTGAITPLILILATNKPKNPQVVIFSNCIQFGLLTSMLGAVALVNEDQFLMLLFKSSISMILFTISYIINIYHFKSKSSSILKKLLPIIILILSYFTILPYTDFIIKHQLEKYVYAYMTTLGFMVTAAIYRMGHTTKLSYVIIVGGSVCLFLSNCIMISQQLFHASHPDSFGIVTAEDVFCLLAIKGLFYFGSFLITIGTIIHVNYFNFINETIKNSLKKQRLCGNCQDHQHTHHHNHNHQQPGTNLNKKLN